MGISLKSLTVVVVALALLLLTPLSEVAVAQDGPSAFPTCYRCGTGLPGAPTLTLQGIVITPNGQFQGVAVLTQAVNPPLNVHVPVSGHYDPNSKTVELVFAGARPGAATHGVLTLSSGWGQPGKCAFFWYANNRFGDSGGNVPAAPCK